MENCLFRVISIAHSFLLVHQRVTTEVSSSSSTWCPFAGLRLWSLQSFPFSTTTGARRKPGAVVWDPSWDHTSCSLAERLACRPYVTAVWGRFLGPGVSPVTSIGGWHHVPNNERCSSVVADLVSLVAVAAVFRLRNSEGKLRLKYALHTHTRHVCVFWILLRSTTIHYHPLHPPVIPQSPLPCQVCMTSGAGTYHWMAPEALVNWLL